jgi:hypothetical protein
MSSCTNKGGGKPREHDVTGPLCGMEKDEVWCNNFVCMGGKYEKWKTRVRCDYFIKPIAI